MENNTNNMNEAERKQLEIQYEVYLEERKSLVGAIRNSIQQFDKAILTLAAGALAISLTFINKIAPHPEGWTLVVLAISWISFVLSMLSTLISFLTSQKACEKQIEILEMTYFNYAEGASKKNIIAEWTKKLNITSITLFVLGVISLVIFSISNLNVSKEDAVSKKKGDLREHGYVPPKTPLKPTDKPDAGYVPPSAPKKPPAPPKDKK